MSSQRGGKKGAAKPEPSGSVLAVDELRKRIAAEAEVIVQETMPRKVPPARPRAPPRRTPARPRTRRAHTHTAGGARAALRADRPCPRARVSVMIPRAKGSPSDGAAAAGRAQVAELTRILEEDELFQYPEKDDLIGPVRAPPASCRARNGARAQRQRCEVEPCSAASRRAHSAFTAVQMKYGLPDAHGSKKRKLDEAMSPKIKVVRASLPGPAEAPVSGCARRCRRKSRPSPRAVVRRTSAAVNVRGSARA